MGENYKTLPIVQKLSKGEETVWVNPKKIPFAENRQGISMADIDEAEARLQRFAPFIMKCFPETEIRYAKASGRNIRGSNTGKAHA